MNCIVIFYSRAGCTSSSSGLGQSGELLAEEAGTGNWLEGHRFRSNPSDSDITTWTDSLK